jgi:hypothetical protein
LLCYLWYARHLVSRIPIFGWLRTDFYVEYQKV